MEKGLSQTELANAVGVSSRTLQRLERGEIEPTLPVVLKAAEILDIEYTSLIYHHESDKEFAFLSKDEVLARPYGKEMIHLSTQIDECIQREGIEACFEKLKQHPLFVNSEISLAASNLFYFYVNPRTVFHIPGGFIANKMYPSGSTYQSRRKTVSAINQLFGWDKSWYSNISTHIFSGRKAQTELMGYFRQVDDHFLNVMEVKVLNWLDD